MRQKLRAHTSQVSNNIIRANTARNHNRFVLQPLRQVTKRNLRQQNVSTHKKNDCLTADLSLSLVLRAVFPIEPISMLFILWFSIALTVTEYVLFRAHRMFRIVASLCVCVCRDRLICIFAHVFFVVLSGFSEIVVSHKWDINSTPKLRIALSNCTHNGEQCLERAQIHQTSAARLHIYGFESGNGLVVARSSVFFPCVINLLPLMITVAAACMR